MKKRIRAQSQHWAVAFAITCMAIMILGQLNCIILGLEDGVKEVTKL